MAKSYIETRVAELEKLSLRELITEIVNGELNRLVARYADYDDDESGDHGDGKRVPYIGWYWRNVDFVGGDFHVGHCGSFIGFMENNKWDYPERRLTPDEAKRVTAIVCEAMHLNNAGGNLAEIIANTKAKLGELWDLLQSFPIEIEGFWIYGPQGNVGFADTEAEADQMIRMLEDAAPGFSYTKVAA